MARLQDILRGWGLAVPLSILRHYIGLKSRGLVYPKNYRDADMCGEF